MSIYFSRHGETDWNIAKRVQGTTDIPLNETGMGQAKLLYENLRKDNVKICRVYSSYQERALTTAQIVGSGFNAPVKVIHGLEEMNLGIFEGHTWEEISEVYPDEHARWETNKRYNRAPEGESYQELLERLFAALDQIIEEAKDDLDLGRDILIVTHGAVIMSLLTLKKDLCFNDSYKYISIENAKALRFEMSDLREIERRVDR